MGSKLLFRFRSGTNGLNEELGRHSTIIKLVFVSVSASLQSMLYGNDQSTVTFVRNLLEILMGFYRTAFHLKSSLDKTKYIFDPSIWECNSYFNHWFSNTKAFLYGIWNLHREKPNSLGSSD